MGNPNPNIKDYGFGSRTKAVMKRIAKKGGLSRSPKKSLAKRIEAAKMYSKDDMKSKALLRAVAMLEDPQLAEADLLIYSQQIKDESLNLDVGERTKVLTAITGVHKTVFGEKIKNLNMNINVDDDKFEKLWEEMAK